MSITTMPSNEERFNRVIAFEVSKADLVAYSVPQGVSSVIPNTKSAIRRYLKKQTRTKPKTEVSELLVVCEATGGYERFVLEAAAELGLACHRAHGSRVRAYARYRTGCGRNHAQTRDPRERHSSNPYTNDRSNPA